MSRSRVVLDLLSARGAARQSRERPWVQSQPSSSGIRNRPALPVSSSSGKSQPVHCVRSGKAAPQSLSSVPKVPSRPFHRQSVQIAVSPKSGARSILDRLQARKDRLAPVAAPSSDKASITVLDRLQARRERLATAAAPSSDKPSHTVHDRAQTQRDRLATAAAPSSDKANATVLDRLQARRDRLATPAAPSTVKASIAPGTTKETSAAIRQRDGTLPRVGASQEKQGKHLKSSVDDLSELR